MGELSIFICLGEHDHDGEMPGVASTTSACIIIGMVGVRWVGAGMRLFVVDNISI